MTDTLCVFQEEKSRSKDQIDGTRMSLGNRKGVRVTGKYVPPVDWGSRWGPSIVHSPNMIPLPPDTPTVISIGPLPHRPPERLDDPRMDDPAAREDWIRGGPSQTRVTYGEMGVPRQTMEELKTILRDKPVLSIRGRDDGKPGSPYTYLHGSSTGGSGGGRPDGRHDDGNSQRVFSTFKPQSDVSRRGPKSRESTSIQLPSSMDSSSAFRSDANTNRQNGIRAHAYASGSSWGETGASNTGRWSSSLIKEL